MIIEVTDRSLIGEARRQAANMASIQGFDAEGIGRISIVVTELGTNLLKYAGGGQIVIETFHDAEGEGIELMSLDKGPGISDLDAALADGHSTGGTPGSGLGAVRRIASVFAINTAPDRGTAVLARMSLAGRRRPQTGYIISQISAPYPGEQVCGDGWMAKCPSEKLTVLLADGSGHGPMAQAAADRAKAAFAEGDGSLEQTSERIHRALGSTRGAAIGLAEINCQHVNYLGIGNISAALIEQGRVRRMISHNGTAGHVAPRMNAFKYPFSGAPTVILHSDGLTARWDLNDYPGLVVAHPSLIAGVLYRDFRRGRDDVSVIAVRRTSSCPPGY